VAYPEQDKDVLVGIADLQVVRDAATVVSTHGLGSGVGLAVYDPLVKVGGILHYMLPAPSERSAPVPSEDLAKYASSGIPLLLETALELGASKRRLIVCAVGAGEFLSDSAGFDLGKRNQNLLRKTLFQHQLRLSAHSLGGCTARTLWLHMSDGSLVVTNRDERQSLWQPTAVAGA
jgi:chemotaxis protein CheD